MLWGEISNLYEIESFQIKTYQSNMGTSLIENFLGLPFPISFSEILFFSDISHLHMIILD